MLWGPCSGYKSLILLTNAEQVYRLLRLPLELHCSSLLSLHNPTSFLLFPSFLQMLLPSVALPNNFLYVCFCLRICFLRIPTLLPCPTLVYLYDFIVTHRINSSTKFSPLTSPNPTSQDVTFPQTTDDGSQPGVLS